MTRVEEKQLDALFDGTRAAGNDTAAGPKQQTRP